MRNIEKMFPVENLFVLGAGASYAATRTTLRPTLGLVDEQTPLDKQFTRELAEIANGRTNFRGLGAVPKWVVPAAKRIVRNGDKFYKKSVRIFERFGLEEAVIEKEAYYIWREIVGKVSKKYSNEELWERYLTALARLIVYRLEYTQDGKLKTYEELTKKWFENKDTQNRIITFNYDIVLDKILQNISQMSPKQLYAPLAPDGKEFLPLTDQDNPILLKLHGSVNWECGQNTYKYFVSPRKAQPLSPPSFFDVSSSLQKTKLEDRYPCIMPPVMSKPVENFEFFSRIWNRASDYLTKCVSLYICGYSLPPTDNLATALFKNFENKSLKAITIIDPNRDVQEKWQQLLNRDGIGQAGAPPEWSFCDDFHEIF